MKALFSYLGAGSVFGAGLALSDMINPARVQAFLLPGPDWDLTLLFVMLGALTVSVPFYRKLAAQPVTCFGDRFEAPPNKRIDGRLLAGALLFGMGWGIAGICPGPLVAQLSYPSAETGLFLLALIMGQFLTLRIVTRAVH